MGRRTLTAWSICIPASPSRSAAGTWRGPALASIDDRVLRLPRGDHFGHVGKPFSSTTSAPRPRTTDGRCTRRWGSCGHRHRSSGVGAGPPERDHRNRGGHADDRRTTIQMELTATSIGLTASRRTWPPLVVRSASTVTSSTTRCDSARGPAATAPPGRDAAKEVGVTGQIKSDGRIRVPATWTRGRRSATRTTRTSTRSHGADLAGARHWYRAGMHPPSRCVPAQRKVVLNRAIGHGWATVQTTRGCREGAGAHRYAVLRVLRGQGDVDDSRAHARRTRVFSLTTGSAVPAQLHQHGKDRTTIRHVMTHSAGVPFATGPKPTSSAPTTASTPPNAGNLRPIYRPGLVHVYHALTWGPLVREIVSAATERTFATSRDEILDSGTSSGANAVIVHRSVAVEDLVGEDVANVLSRCGRDDLRTSGPHVSAW